jgi:ferredoxin--NADP+ reductase
VYKILAKKRLSPTITVLTLDTKEIARKVKPGQFVIIRMNEEGERIPLTVNDFDRERGTITIVFQEVGKTLRYIKHQ